MRATHRWPVVGSLYRSIYAAAARSAGGLAWREPRLVGVYARNSYALGTWEPGRSDIDLTIVCESPDAELAAQCYRDIAQLRQRFPMIGEVEMIDARHLAAWTGYGVAGLESRRWKKLGGAHTFDCRYAGCERMDRIRHAVSIYCHQFIPRFWEQPRHLPTLRRFAAKISRQLNMPPGAESDPAGLLGNCLTQMRDAIRTLPEAPASPTVDYQTLLGRLASPAPRTPANDQGVLAVIAHAPDANSRHVLVHDDFRAASANSRFQNAAILNEDVFRFYLCYVDPLEYFTLLRQRSILSGIDPLREPLPLSQSALHETVCHYAADLLTFPYRPGLDSLPERQFRDLLLGWFLRTLKYFEDGTFTFEYHLLREHFGVRHDETGPRFQLLHRIAGEVAARMER